MRLELEILDGDNKGKRISLRNGLVIGRMVDAIVFDDDYMAELHAVVNLDGKKTWNIECLGENRVRLGYEEVVRATGHSTRLSRGYHSLCLSRGSCVHVLYLACMCVLGVVP